MRDEQGITGEGMGVEIYNMMARKLNGMHDKRPVEAGRPVPKTTEKHDMTMRPVAPKGVGPSPGRAKEPASEKAGIAKTLAVRDNKGYAAKKTHY